MSRIQRRHPLPALCFALGLVAASAPNANAASNALALASNIGPYNHPDFTRPSWSKQGDIVTLAGMVVQRSQHDWGLVATLPSEARPPAELIFDVNSHQGRVRVSIGADGQVVITDFPEQVSHGWISLGGIHFSTRPGRPVPLRSGVTSLGTRYGEVTFIEQDGIVTLQGAVRDSTNKWGVIATLPEGARPRQQLIYSANAHGHDVRVDVQTNGQIAINAGTGPIEHGWVSLSGISFAIAGAEKLVLGAGLRPIGGAFGGTHVIRSGNRVLINGSVYDAKDTFGVVAVLPPELRPPRHLIFSGSTHRDSVRVNVTKDGEVQVNANTGPPTHKWVSLSNISYTLPSSAPTAAPQAPPRYDSVRLPKDVPALFATLNLDGERGSLRSSYLGDDRPENHIQGVATYKGTHLITHSTRDHRDDNLLVYHTRRLQHRVPTGARHPGGIQRYGDILVVGVEDPTPAVLFYDLRPLPLKPPVLIARQKIDGGGSAAGAGIAADSHRDGSHTWVVGSTSPSTCKYWTAHEQRGAPRSLIEAQKNWFSGSHVHRMELPGYAKKSGAQGMNLVFDEDGTLYQVNVVADTHVTTVRDYAALMQIGKVETDPSAPDFGKVTFHAPREMGTAHLRSDSEQPGPLGVHARYGGGLDYDGARFDLTLTARNLVTGWLEYNVFGRTSIPVSILQGGSLMYYEDRAQDGTPRWSIASRIGGGWGDMRKLLGGYDGVLYAVNSSGKLLFYQDLAQDGSPEWRHARGAQIGSGWGGFRHVFGGWEGKIYVVDEAGKLKIYRDLARDGTARWMNGGARTIGSGWNKFVHVFGGWEGKIYAIDGKGKLYFYHDLAQDGRVQWSENSGRIIGSGWGDFGKTAFGGWEGKIYVQKDGKLYFYRDLAQNGTANWSKGSGQVIGSGWSAFSKATGGWKGKIYTVKE